MTSFETQFENFQGDQRAIEAKMSPHEREVRAYNQTRSAAIVEARTAYREKIARLADRVVGGLTNPETAKEEFLEYTRKLGEAEVQAKLPYPGSK